MDVRNLIPNPCPEDFSKMSPTEKGAFCSKCQFEVVDFTQKSDEAIIRYLSQTSGRVCGRVKATNPQLPKWLKWTTIAASILLFYWDSAKLKAQSAIVKSPVSRNTAEDSSVVKTISGTVYDADVDEELPFASIIALYEGEIVGRAQSDIDGKFVVHLDSALQSPKVDIRVSFVGYADRFVQDVPVGGKYYCELSPGTFLGIIMPVPPMLDIRNPSTGSHWDGNTMIGGTGPID